MAKHATSGVLLDPEFVIATEPFHALADGVLGAAQRAKLIAACWRLGDSAELWRVVSLARHRGLALLEPPT